MEFKVGDKVELLGIPCGFEDVHREYASIIGTQGIVEQLDTEQRSYKGGKVIRVGYTAPNGDTETMWFSLSDVAPWGRRQCMRPEMELEEIEMAQEVFDVLQNR